MHLMIDTGIPAIMTSLHDQDNLVEGVFSTRIWYPYKIWFSSGFTIMQQCAYVVLVLPQVAADTCPHIYVTKLTRLTGSSSPHHNQITLFPHHKTATPGATNRIPKVGWKVVDGLCLVN